VKKIQKNKRGLFEDSREYDEPKEMRDSEVSNDVESSLPFVKYSDESKQLGN
jgi:hypothetical protein